MMITGSPTFTSLAAAPLQNIKVVNDRAPDCSSLEAIVASVTRGCKSDDERAIAIYNFCRYIYYHHAYPHEKGGISALKFINVYGWALCGGQHTVMAALWEKAGFKWRYRGWSRPGWLRREVLAAGQAPLPVRAEPSEPKVGPGETLATLPNPWLIGARR